jgi:phosphatidylserine decarboxylase
MGNSTRELGASLIDYLKAWPTYLLPMHALSRVMHRVTRSEVRWWKTAFTRWFVNRFEVDMSQAQEPDLGRYPSFNAFFTRALRADARPIAGGEDVLACPVDGAVSQIGTIEDGRIFQAKGQDYSLLELLAGDSEHAKLFADGQFATFYLSPRDYHRIHIPIDGQLRAMSHIPGRLFSVSPATVRVVPRLFARNERVVAYFDTAAGPMAVVMVGAIFVASIDTVWAGEVTPPAGKTVRRWTYDTGDSGLRFVKGAEIGRFNMGSTVILLFGQNAVQWRDEIQPGSGIRLGQALATRGYSENSVN